MDISIEVYLVMGISITFSSLVKRILGGLSIYGILKSGATTGGGTDGASYTNILIHTVVFIH